MAEAEAEVVGWVAGEVVGLPALGSYMAAVAQSLVGDRVGVGELGWGSLGAGSRLGAKDLGEAAAREFSKRSALRAWAAKGLLADLLAEREAARLGVEDPASVDQWVSALEGAAEIRVELPVLADALECYRANEQRFRVREARRVRHLLVDGLARAKELAAEVVGTGGVAAASLAELAERCTLDEGSRCLGGDLGWVERGQLAGALEDEIFAATPGQLRGPVKSQFGWHLLVVEEVRGANLRPFEDCRDEILSELAVDRRRAAFRQWWAHSLAKAVRVPAGAEHPVHPGLPGSSHRH